MKYFNGELEKVERDELVECGSEWKAEQDLSRAQQLRYAVADATKRHFDGISDVEQETLSALENSRVFVKTATDIR